MEKQITYDQLIAKMITELSLMTGIPEAQIRADQTFESLRINSIHAMQLLDELEELTGKEISPLLMFEYPSLGSFAKKITE